MTNFTQIIDEIQQQKIAVSAQIDDINALIAAKQQEIADLQLDIPELTQQLAGLVTLEEKTQELQQTANDTNINLNINVNGAQVSSSTSVNHSVTWNMA